MRSTSVVPRVVSQLEDIFRMHHPTRNNYCILYNEQCEKPRTKIFRRSYNVFPSPIYNPLISTMAAAMDVDDDMGESSGLGTDKAGKKRFEVKKVTFP